MKRIALIVLQNFSLLQMVHALRVQMFALNAKDQLPMIVLLVIQVIIYQNHSRNVSNATKHALSVMDQMIMTVQNAHQDTSLIKIWILRQENKETFVQNVNLDARLARALKIVLNVMKAFISLMEIVNIAFWDAKIALLESTSALNALKVTIYHQLMEPSLTVLDVLLAVIHVVKMAQES